MNKLIIMLLSLSLIEINLCVISPDVYYKNTFLQRSASTDNDTTDIDSLSNEFSESKCFDADSFNKDIRRSIKKLCTFIRPCRVQCKQKLSYRHLKFRDDNNNLIHTMRLYNLVELFNKTEKSGLKYTVVNDRIFRIDVSRVKRLSNPSVKQVIGAYEVGVGASCVLSSWMLMPAILTGGVMLPAEVLALGICGADGVALLALQDFNKIFSWY